MKNYFDELENLEYPEICETIEDMSSYGGNVACRIPVLMHSISTGDKKDIPIPGKKPNILNINFNPSPTTLTTSNYIMINVPEYIARDLPANINNIVKKGQKLIIVFIGGDISNIKVIGRYS